MHLLIIFVSVSGSSGDELEVSGVTTGEEEDLDSVDSGQLSPRPSNNQDALEIIPVQSDNVQTNSDHVQSRRKSTPQQIIDSYQIPGISLHESDAETDIVKHKLSPGRNASSPDESSSREFSFTDAFKLRNQDVIASQESKRKSSDEASSLRIKSVEALLKSQDDKSAETKGDDVRLKAQDMVVPSELLVRSRREREGREGVWARSFIARGVRYGPFAGKWASLPADSRYAWEVCKILFMFTNLLQNSGGKNKPQLIPTSN